VERRDGAARGQIRARTHHPQRANASGSASRPGPVVALSRFSVVPASANHVVSGTCARQAHAASGQLWSQAGQREAHSNLVSKPRQSLEPAPPVLDGAADEAPSLGVGRSDEAPGLGVSRSNIPPGL